MSVLVELERFITAHCACGRLDGDADRLTGLTAW
jgi:hypothetical protein